MWAVLLVPLVVGSAYALNIHNADFTEMMHISDTYSTKILSAIKQPFAESIKIGDSYSTKILSVFRQPFSDKVTIGDSYTTKLLSAVQQPFDESVTINDSYPTKIIPATSKVLYDDFNDNNTDVSKWVSESGSSGTEIDEVNRRVEVSHSASASGYIFYSQYKSVCKLKGDFDIQVDYQLLQWPSSSGIRVGLAVRDMSSSSLPTWTVERVSISEVESTVPKEVYLTNFNGAIRGLEGTQDPSGTLRLVRSGNTITGYSGSEALASGRATTNDVGFIIASWGHDFWFSGEEIKVAFDDMKINKGTLVGCN